ncbi:hypothetical protein JCM8097_009216 [Rhodosporidiobolus ruineniae]
MTLRYSGQIDLLKNGSPDGYSRLGPTSFAVPHLPSRLALVYDPRVAQYFLEWKAATPVYVASGTIAVSVANQSLLNLTLSEGSFPPTVEGRLGSTAAKPAEGFESVWLQVELVVRPTPGDRRAQERAVFAASTSTSFLNHVWSDVLISFPRTGNHLWAHEAFLEKGSPYFKRLLPTLPVTLDGHPATSKVEAFHLEESDAETDQTIPQQKATSLASGIQHKYLEVTQFAFSTYFAVFVWLQSRHIVFAPLLSSFLHPKKTHADAASARKAAIKALHPRGDSRLPPPVSPKSIYRLARSLELDDLALLALDNFRSQLTPSVAAYELFSGTALTCSGIRDAVVPYVAEHWAEVRETEAMKAMMERGVTGELDPLAGTLLLVLRGVRV